MSPEKLTITGDAGGEPSARRRTGSGAIGQAKSAGLKARLSKTNLLLAGMFTAGLACMYLLWTQGGPPKASAQENTTEARVASTLSSITAKAMRQDGSKNIAVIEALRYEAKHRQLPLSSLQCNPFIFTPAPLPAHEEGVDGATGEKRTTNAPTGSHAQALLEVKKLSLQTILTGSNGSTAMISNNLLAEGQTIGGWTVSKISPNEVLLTWKDKTYVLRLP